MTEPDVTLRDYALAVMTLVFTAVVLRTPAEDRAARRWLATLFAGLAAGAALGGTVHGFFADPGTLGYAVLWPATLIAIGVTALGAWGFGAALLFRPRAARLVAGLATLAFAVYCAVVLLVSQDFLTAIANYLPAALFLLFGFGRLAVATRARPALGGFLGLLLSFAAAGVQQAGISLHPVYLTHNTLYHLIQMVGLVLIFLAGRWALRRPGPGRGQS